MMKKSLVKLAVVICALALGTTSLPSDAHAQPPDRITVCHARGNGTLKELTISSRALSGHRGHGDGLPGELVPGNEDFIFTETCELVPANEPPIGVDDEFVVSESSVVAIDVLANDFDPDGDPLQIVAVGLPALGVTSTNGSLVSFDPNGEFVLALGQVEVVSFTYDITDGNGELATATVTLIVAGDGPVVVEGSASGVTRNTEQDVTIELSGDSTSADGTADMDVSVNFGAVIQPLINIVYIVDTSGSTIASVLAQETSALNNLTNGLIALGFPDGAVTVSIVPFSGTVGPDQTGDDVSTFVLDETDDGASSDQQDIAAALGALNGGGFTNYIVALAETVELLDSLEATRGVATNLVYFLSDGQPVVRDPVTGQIVQQSVADIAAAAAPLHTRAQVSAFEIGNVDATEFLDALDNTGGAESIDNPADLTAALVGSPIPSGAIVAAQLIVSDDLGSTTIVDIDPNDFVETPFGLELALTGVTGFSSLLGGANNVTLTVEFDDNDDGITDLTLSVELTVYGVA